MNLKTLKDIGCFHKLYGLGSEKPKKIIHGVDGDELKKEAIVWAKMIKKSLRNPNHVSMSISSTAGEVMRMIAHKESTIVLDWIMHFFNITEKELEE